MSLRTLLAPLALLLLAGCEPATGPEVPDLAERTLPLGGTQTAPQTTLYLYRSGDKLPMPPYGQYDLSTSSGMIVVTTTRTDTLEVLLQVLGAKPQDPTYLFYQATPDSWETTVAAWANGDRSRAFGPWTRHATLITDDMGGAYGRYLIPLKALAPSAKTISFWINRPVSLPGAYGGYPSTTATFLISPSMSLPGR